jgi:VCBS repeat-containing protein
VLFIDGFGRQTSSFPVGGPVGVRVVEPARNFDPQQRETTFIQLQVPGDQETVTLLETGFNTGIFEGTIGSERGGPQTNDNRLEGQAGQTIFATYQNVTTPNPTLAQAVFTGGQVLFVDNAGQPASVYLVGTRARVRVEDHGADARSFAVDTVLSTVFMELSGDFENLTLTETGPNTGVFEAEVQLREGPALPGDGVLETREEFGPPHEFDTLHASYTTGDGGVSTAQAGTLSFRIWFIDASGQVVTAYTQGPRVYVRIEDHRFNDPGALDRSFARVRSASGDAEVLELTETGLTTGIYEGSLRVDLQGTPGQDGRLQAHPGDQITAERDTGFTAELAVARIDFTTVNSAPVAANDSATVAEDGTVSVAVLANDTDPDGDTLTVTSVTQGAHGAASINPDQTVQYTPAANYNGSDSFTYTISDGNGESATATVNVTVTAVNDAPVANADTATVAEDGTVSVAALANDTDLDGDTLTVASVTQGAHGTVSINPDKTVKYTPAANYNGSDSFTYTVSDGNGGTATATVTVTITAVNDAPVANADTATVAEDGTVSVNVLSNDTDADGDTLTVSSVTQGAHGTVSINPDKTVQYTPVANYNGSDSFTYTISDGNGGTATATVTVAVTAANDAPVANADTATVAEDGNVSVTVLSNDTDADGDTLTVISVTQGAHGTVSINSDQTVKYTPAANYNGSDSFTYTISDGNGGTATATVTVAVTAVNDAPVANADTATVAEDGNVSVTVLSNDTDPDGDTLTVSSVTQGAHGTVSINPDKTVKYTPAANYNGSDSFTYTIADGNGGTATATVTVTVTGVNDAPVANADTATVAEDGTVSVAVLSNDTDLDGDTLTVASVTQGAHDTVSINSDKTVKYTPAANYNGSDSFTYTISDGNGGTATATVTVTITAVNDAPVANADTATVAEDGNVSVTVLANDSDADGDTLTVASVTQGTHGSVSINPDKTVKYTPAANYNGSDSFTYTVSDGNGGTATATVTVTITAVNDSPVANADTATVAEDGTVAVTVLSNDTDPDGDTLTVASVTQGAHGTVSINPDKTVKYTPAANYNGPDAFTYTISDGHGGTATAAVTVSVTTVNDPPVAVNDASATVAGSAVTINVLANDSDIDSPVLMVTSITQGAQGTVVINPDKTVTYTAGLFVGTDSFTYTISDGNGGTATATVTVTVAAPPRVATGIQARYDFNEGSGATVADTSGVGTPLSLTISSTSNVSWVSGGLTVNTATKISNSSQATKIITAAKASNAVTVEAWITPASLSLTGPARILDLSKNSAQRNLVFGQSSNRYETQLKTSTTTASLQSPAASLTLNLTHVVYTRNSSGQAAYYVNGVQVSSQTQSGNLSSWGTDQSLTLSDNWQGTYYLVAVYGRALTTSEVQQNYLAGVN